MKLRLLLPALALLAIPPSLSAQLPALKVSANARFLTQADGAPFFWLGDTAWELFHRLTREEAEHHLRTRAAQGYTVIQAVVLAEFDGLNEPNAYGHRPLRDNNPLQPDESYFAHVDWVLQKAESLGLYVGLLPTWGDKWNKARGAGPEVFTAANAEAYGEWLGRRYANRALIWILGGDRQVENETHAGIIRAMAAGLRRGDGGRHLITFHPPGGSGSSKWFHRDDWLDFNLRQNGHTTEYTDRYAATRADYDLTPTKPVIDGEPLYEGHPIAFAAKTRGHSTAADVRRPLYWDLFSGACGHTYGHHSIWQFYTKDRKPVNGPLMPWRAALDEPGARQMQHGRRLLESRPIFSRIPDDDILVPADVATSVPGAGQYRFVATRDTAGTYAMIYAPLGRAFTVRMTKIASPKIKAWWFDPRTGQATAAGDYSNEGTREFIAPNPGEVLDWVLVLDDATKNYPPPGTGKFTR
ncbi:MAG TPA: glycoside hydrolase family 140 protein [Opitutaceae bacterium]|nr:glycoside hydrolase family 140 protein [Opitutaceae bacterium]